ncbi:hypothetical protein WJX79_009518 [Trebouxia sp. C0005]
MVATKSQSMAKRFQGEGRSGTRGGKSRRSRMRWSALLVLLLTVAMCMGQKADTQSASGPEAVPNPTPKPYELSTSVLTPQQYKPADHVDQASYDINEPSGLETAIQDLLRKVRFATWEEIIDHYTFNKHPDEHADMHRQVLAALQHLISSGAVILNDNMYYPSFRQPGDYKLDLSGDVNMLRHPVVHALQQHPGIAHAEVDEHFIRDKHPAWYETWAFPRK